MGRSIGAISILDIRSSYMIPTMLIYPRTLNIILLYQIVELQALIEETREDLQPKRRVNQVKRNFKTRHELRMTAQIGDYDMDYIILDLGSDINILT